MEEAALAIELYLHSLSDSHVWLRPLEVWNHCDLGDQQIAHQ